MNDIFWPAMTMRLVFAAILASTVGYVQAQSSAAPDNIRRDAERSRLLQQERERALRQQQERATDVHLQAPAEHGLAQSFPTGEMPCVAITRVTFGDELGTELSQHFGFALQNALENGSTAETSAGGLCLGTQGVNIVLKRVQNALFGAGYITTRVMLAPQNLHHGVLVLSLIPGRVRQIRFAPDADIRATQWNAVPRHAYGLLNLRDIEQAMENFKRVPTADADIRIEPGIATDASPGDSDLVISYQQAFPFRLTTGFDDGGSVNTGKYQSNLTLSYDNWWTLNDLFYVSANHDLGGSKTGDHGSSGYTVHYSLPFAYWNLGATLSSSRYQQEVAGYRQSYCYRGTSDNTEIKLSRLMYRDTVNKTTVILKGLLRSSANYIDDTEILAQRRRTTAWELALQHRTSIGNATLHATLAYRRGIGAFGAMPAPEEKFGEGDARFQIIITDLNLQLPFHLQMPWGKQSLRYQSDIRAQRNNTALTPQDRFAIGGRYTVRGFDGELILAAERGLLVRNELGIALGTSDQELYLGVDYGEVDGPTADLLLGRRLMGAVIGLRGGWRALSWDIFAGTPLLRPDNFRTAAVAAGFNLLWSF